MGSRETEKEEIKVDGKIVVTIYKPKKVVVAVSGGFDPVHRGHIRHFRDAKKLGDELVVFLQTDDWLMKKKGEVFMTYEERKEIILAIKYVDRVVKTIDTDMTQAKTLEMVKPDIFAKGGDRVKGNLPKEELRVCKDNGIRIVFNVGGGKVQSSSWLIERMRKQD